MNNAQYRRGAVQEPASSLLPVLEETLSQLRQMYSERQLRPGAVDRICIRQGWITVIGTTMECGIAPYFGDVPDRRSDTPSQVLRQVQSLIGMPLLVLPDLKLSLNAILDPSVKLAALCALSQPFLGCPTIRKKGWQAECWRSGDPFIQENPALSRLIRPDDIVAVAGPYTSCRGVWEICRELHMLTPDPETWPETLGVSAARTTGPTKIRRHSFEEQKEVLGNADVVLLPSSTLVEGTFETCREYAKNARLTGLVGTGASLVPDAFFSRGIDFIQSCRTIDTRRFEDTFMNDPDPVPGLFNFQKEYLFVRQEGTRSLWCHRQTD
jgi:Uncharacterized conserved protein